MREAACNIELACAVYCSSAVSSSTVLVCDSPPLLKSEAWFLPIPPRLTRITT